MNLKNKNIILTGASSGIGLALIEELARYNCNIVAVARSIDKVNIISIHTNPEQADAFHRKTDPSL